MDWDEQPLFKKRFTKTAGYELTPEELELYNAVTKYVRSRRKEAKAKRNRNVELTLMVMQRRLASSIYAITCTLQNRLNAINEVLEILRDPRRTPVEKKKLLHGNGEDIPSNIAEYDELDGQQKSLTLLIMPPENAYSENGGGMNLIPSPIQKYPMDLSSKCGSRGSFQYLPLHLLLVLLLQYSFFLQALPVLRGCLLGVYDIHRIWCLWYQ
ncbi:MAG: hypothetical protein QG588_975 [Candidatus Poribacteria bacterium]|nr:hypothetical protein [Candidatus Poribacteria bacterium]